MLRVRLDDDAAVVKAVVEGNAKVAPRMLASSSPQPGGDAAVHPNHPVLVVEDEPDIRDMMVALLESQGYSVSAACDGADALAQLQAGSVPCIILLDLMMPVMDGWTFCREKEKDPVLAEIPVVVVSAVSRQDPRNQALVAVEHVPKPIEVPALLATVARFC